MTDHESYDAAAALADVQASRDELARRMATPWWYFWAIGTPLAAMVVAMGVASNAIVIGIVVVLCLAIVLSVTAYQRKTGLWLGLAQAGPRTRIRWILLGIVLAAAYAMGIADRFFVHWGWLAVVGGVLALVAYVVGGPLIDRQMREDLRQGVSTPKPLR